jgi:hypothetical protein
MKRCGQVTLQTSKDPVGAPIFTDAAYAVGTGEGVIKPLPPNAIPLVGWRLRNIGESGSRLLLEGMPTCANCHSFSGWQNHGNGSGRPPGDKACTPLPRSSPMSIRNEEVMSWNAFQSQPASLMSRVHVANLPTGGTVTSVNGSKSGIEASYYVANFKDYRFLRCSIRPRDLAW